MNASNPPPEPRLRQLFLAALDITDPAQRNQFLEQACGADTALREQIQALLTQHKSDSFLEHPPFDPGSSVTVQADAPQPDAAPGRIQVNLPAAAETIRYFGDYELLGELARGGMGVVYRARQKSLNRIVAVKMILGGQLATEADVKRFHTEAEAAANLKHPNIVPIHEIGEHEGRHYFSMDLIEGKNLHQMIGGTPMTVAKAATLLKTLAEAIQYAHQRGILHRDLKPQNVLMDAEGQPHITDFGLAKQMAAGSDLTHTGTVMGSPSYMPPEQATGRQAEIGPATDVYSLGAILYQMLTGKAPFLGATVVDTLRQVIEQEPVPPSKLNGRVPRDLETICLKCLEKKPERRYASARALAEELGRFLKNEPILARPANPVRRVWSWFLRHPWIVTGLASLVVMLVVGFAYRMWVRVDAVEWRAAHLKETPPFNSDYFFPVWFNFLLFLEFFFFQGVPVSSFLALRARKQRGNWFYYLFAITGAVQLVFGLDILRRAVAIQAWEPQFISGPFFALIAALTNVWLGSVLAWKAIREARLDLPGVAASEELIEHPLKFSNRKVIKKAFAYEAIGGISLSIVVGINTVGTEQIDAVIGLFTGMFGMCVITWLVLIGRLIVHSKGLERQARLPIVVVLFAPAAIGLYGLITPTWYATLVFYILGFFVGRLLLKRCPLQRGGVLIQIEKRSGGAISQEVYIIAAGMACLALFYCVENWRGMRAWEKAKARLEARGERVEWAAFVPKARVPDEENVFKHPFIQEYSIGKPWTGNYKGLSWFDTGFLGHGLEVGPPVPMATLKQLPTQRETSETFASLDPSLARAATVSEISYTNTPLVEVIQSLARQAGLKINVASGNAAIISQTSAQQLSVKAGKWPWVYTNQPVVPSFKATNITAAAALDVLLKQYYFQPELDAASGSYKLKPIYTSLVELMERLTHDNAQLRQLEEALQRPKAQLDWNWQSPLKERTIQNFVQVRSAAQGLCTRSKIHLLQGHPDAALTDLKLMNQLADFSASTPSLVGAMLKVAIEGLRVEILKESLGDGLWPATHLAAVQEEFAEVDLLTPWSAGTQYERAFATEAIRRLATSGSFSRQDYLDYMLHVGANPGPTFERKLLAAAMLVSPRGWFYQNMAQVCGDYELWMLAVDSRRQTVSSDKTRSYQGDFYWEPRIDRSPYNFIASITLPNDTPALFTTAKNQTLVNEAFVACALERYRAAKGNYPEKLTDLVPEFAVQLPHDLFDGQPLRYRRSADGKYLLYSIGWNNKDDGGQSPPSQPYWNYEQGDLVWQGVPKR